MIVDEAGDDLSRLAAEVARLRIILATTLSVLLLVVGALAWIVELLVP
jgi:CHASE3 domain sensor protein